MLWAAFTLGFVGSMHCVAMCGPLALAVPAGKSVSWRWVYLRLSYQFGRILSYSFLGVLVALLGKSFSLAGWQQGLSILSGLLLLALAFSSVKVENWLTQNSLSHFLQQNLKKLLHIALKKGGGIAHFGMGVFNGLLPCGLVYAALAGAMMSGNALAGMGWMVVFGLGTLPALTGILVLGNLKPFKASRIWRLAGPALSLTLGLMLILRGLNLGIPYLSPILEWSEKIIPVCGT